MTLLIALILEWRLGDPVNRRHPVAWFGRWASWCEQLMYKPQRQVGVLVWLLVLTVPMLLVAWGHNLFGWLFDVLILWVCLGWKSLFEHVSAVLNASHLKASRHAVSLIVSRDHQNMSFEDTRRAALESLAENASDAVVAPLFWFILLGPLGAACYRIINTLDAMWGYRNKRYDKFGWCAAKADDIANYVPARLTARLMLWVGKPASWQDVKTQAETHASPNAGWPEVALAYAADVKLGGSVWRGGKKDKRPNYGSATARQPDEAVATDAFMVVRKTLLLAAGLAIAVNIVL